MAAEKAAVDAALARTMPNGLPQKASAPCAHQGAAGAARRAQPAVSAVSRSPKAAWEQRKAAIEGAADQPDTLANLDAQIEYMKDGLPRRRCKRSGTSARSVARRDPQGDRRHP